MPCDQDRPKLSLCAGLQIVLGRKDSDTPDAEGRVLKAGASAEEVKVTTRCLGPSFPPEMASFHQHLSVQCRHTSVIYLNAGVH